MDDLHLTASLLSDFILFVKVFYKLRTGREFIVPPPRGRHSHILTIANAYHGIANNQIQDVIINIPPRYGKTELSIHFVAWMLARYPDSNFMYLCYSHMLAKKQTQTIKQIISLPHYYNLFNVKITAETRAKDNFETTAGGSVYAAGAMGTIMGRGAGIYNVNRFGGSIIIDDIHKPTDIFSDTIRGNTNEWYFNTLKSRLNSPKTPIILIGQRVHEDDLVGNILESDEKNKWHKIIMPALDGNNNALDPTKHTIESLLQLKQDNPYIFSAQYQQNPLPPGGSVFKSEWLTKLYEEPSILSTFITVDTAETSKTYNDATVFSFWGIYKIKHDLLDIQTDMIGLHWLDTHQCWIEPKDLQNSLLSFWAQCMQHRIKPKFIGIEKKSTGTTLISVTKSLPGLYIHEIERNKIGKSERFLDAQPSLAQGLVSISPIAKHYELVCDHLDKITLNNAHRYDDIADTFADAVKLALIDKVVQVKDNSSVENNVVLQRLYTQHARIATGRAASWQR